MIITDTPLPDGVPCPWHGTKVLLLADTALAVDSPWSRIDERSSPYELASAVRAALGQEATTKGCSQGELSLRERQVLQHVATGLTHIQTAHRLGISPHTVDTYIRRIRAKLGLGNKAQLTRAALAHSV
ncbi:response regulator transcription factor [Streptomyces sp. NPDC019531]|uniref:response regulator transcription factor n=1 Tax=Streptomyces sp. NPDC019531 TaxID=3365062 RepID=UPI00384E1669